MRFLSALAVLGIGGGSVALTGALQNGSSVEESWGTQLSTLPRSTVQANTIITDNTANVFAGGQYEGVLGVASTGSSTLRTLTAPGRIGGYVVGMANRGGYVDGRISWTLNIETKVANSDGASVSSLKENNGKLFVAGSYDTDSAAASLLSASGSTLGSPTTIRRSGNTSMSTGIFVLGFVLSNFNPTLEWTFTSDVFTTSVERNIKIDTDGTTIYTAVSEQSRSGTGRDTRIFTILADPGGVVPESESAVQTSIVLSSTEFKDIAYIQSYNAASGYIAVLMDTSADTITANVTRADGTFAISTLVSGIQDAPASILLALDKDFTPKWMVSATNFGLEMSGLASDLKSGVYFVGTHRGSANTVVYQYIKNADGLSQSSTTATLAVPQKSNIFVGHIWANGAFDPNFLPAQTTIGGIGEDIGHSIDYRHDRLTIAAAIDGVAVNGQTTQAVVVSIDPTTGAPKWAAIVAGERDNTVPFDVAIVPQTDNLGRRSQPDSVLTGSFSGTFDYRSITMTSQGSQDGFILPATAP